MQRRTKAARLTPAPGETTTTMATTKQDRLTVHRAGALARLLPVAALVLSLVLSLGSVAAADPAVTANPALVPFSEVPGQPGVTTLTFTANGTAGLTACGQDNSQPPFALGLVDPNTPLVLNFPFIQAGKYTFWVSTDPACAVANKFAVGGTPVQATAARLGPNGKPGQDDIRIRFTGSYVASDPTTAELILASTSQTFPISDARVCIMSGDGAQVNIAVQVGQDARPQGLGAAAVTRTVMPIAGQNGCFPIPWVVNGAYVASITRSGVSYSVGFCLGAGAGANAPSNPPTAAGIGKCAQIALTPDPNGGPFPLSPAMTIRGSIVTGADNHAVQVCASAFAPGVGGTPATWLPNTVSTYNGSGAANLSPLKIPATFPTKTVLKLSTYDITNPFTAGGTGGGQFVCPTATATQVGQTITAIIVPDVPGATIIDSKNYFFT